MTERPARCPFCSNTDLIRADETFAVGELSPEGWEVGPPFGQELVSAIAAFFPDSAEVNSKYQIRIISRTDDVGKTTVSRPSGPVSHVGLVFRRS